MYVYYVYVDKYIYIYSMRVYVVSYVVTSDFL